MKVTKRGNFKEGFINYLDTFWTFFKIGLFTFGGGYVALSFIQKELTEKKKWITEKEMLDLMVIVESTPGPLSINAATFIGHKRGGFLGAFLATLGVVLPSVVVVIFLSIFLKFFTENKYVQGFLKGIQAGVSVLIFSSAYRLSTSLQKTTFNLVIFLLAFSISFFTSFSVIYIVMILVLFGFAWYYMENKDKKDA